MYEDRRVRELEDQGVPRNIARYAINRMKRAGMDDQYADVAAIYDSNLSDKENKQLFDNTYPVASTEQYARQYGVRGADRENYRAAESRAQEIKNQSQETKQYTTPFSNSDLSNGSYVRKDYRKEGPDLDKSMPPPNEPSLFDKITGRVQGLKNEYENKRQEDLRKREFQAKEKTKQMQYEVKVKSTEARAKYLERQSKQYDRQNNPILNYLDQRKEARQAPGPRRYPLKDTRPSYLTDQSSMLRSTLMQPSRPGYGNAPSPAMNLLMGRAAPPKGKTHYRTVIERGVVRRERIPDTGQMAPQEAQSPAMAALLGKSGPSPLFNNQRNAPSTLLSGNRVNVALGKGKLAKLL